jgi:acyl-CoA dehydrogenase
MLTIVPPYGLDHRARRKLGESERCDQVQLEHAAKRVDRLFESGGEGVGTGVVHEHVDRAERRETFGQPLRDHQAVAHKLAEMATRTLAARLLVYHAAACYDAGAERVRKEAAMAKLYATETAQEVVDAAVQIHGAQGLERGHRLEHLYRDVRSPRIYEGTSEIQRTIIARELYR